MGAARILMKPKKCYKFIQKIKTNRFVTIHEQENAI